MISFDVKNSVAFVTGTNKPNGIGRAVVEALVASGAKKVYATARQTSQLDDLVSKHEGKVVAVALDVTDFECVKALPSKYPDVNLVVNNAGFFGGTTSLDEIEVARKEMEINYFAPLALVKSFSKVFDGSKTKTAVVNINSIASLVSFPAGGTYSASKAAVHSLTQSQRRDLPKTLVIGVYPGPIETDMTKELPFDKASPVDVASRVIDALRKAEEDVFPDNFAANLYQGWKNDAKAVEIQMAKSVSVEA